MAGDGERPQAGGVRPGAEGEPRIAVACVTTGSVRGKRAARGLRRYLPGGWSAETLPVNAFAVEHPAGVCLFDAGQEARAGEPGYLPRWHPFLRLARFELHPEDEAAPQLVRMGIEPQAVRWVVLSHLHTDHVGGLAPFAGAEVIVARAEWERARGLGGRLRGYVPKQWPAGLVPRLVEFNERPVGPFPGSVDLAGDGALVVVPTPGHTLGHVSLLARANGGAYLCAGDLAETAADLPRAAPELAAYCHRRGIVVLTAHDARAPALLEGAARRAGAP